MGSRAVQGGDRCPRPAINLSVLVTAASRPGRGSVASRDAPQPPFVWDGNSDGPGGHQLRLGPVRPGVGIPVCRGGLSSVDCAAAAPPAGRRRLGRSRASGCTSPLSMPPPNAGSGSTSVPDAFHAALHEGVGATGWNRRRRARRRLAMCSSISATIRRVSTVCPCVQPRVMISARAAAALARPARATVRSGGRSGRRSSCWLTSSEPGRRDGGHRTEDHGAGGRDRGSAPAAPHPGEPGDERTPSAVGAAAAAASTGAGGALPACSAGRQLGWERPTVQLLGNRPRSSLLP
jgi:hypothetical protein